MSAQKISEIGSGVLLIANDLHTGQTVFRTARESWSADVADALVFNDLPVAHALLTAAEIDSTKVVDPYLVAVDEAGRAKHIREAIRTLGPTFQIPEKYSALGYDFVAPR